MRKVQIKEISRIENERAVLDLSRVYQLSNPGDPGNDRRSEQSDQFDLSGIFRRISVPQGNRTLVPMPPAHGLRLLRDADLITPLPAHIQQQRAALRVRPLQTGKFSALKSREIRRWSGNQMEDLGRRDIEIPSGLPRYINAKTLKTMLGAGAGDVLFRKDGERWHVCPDSYRVDLGNPSQLYRLNEIQVAS